MDSYGHRLTRAQDRYGHLCVGIDPHPELLDAWDLPRSADGVRVFGLRVLEALEGTVGVVKPQSALFEEYGSAGIAALEDVLASARERSILTILDVKRGDIGSTMAAYARAYLSEDSPLRADAITVSPYLGVASLEPALSLAKANNRGVYILALTSNPEAPAFQHAVTADGTSVAAAVAAGATAHNADSGDKHHLGHVGLVVGATTGSAALELGIDLNAVNGSLLAPGLGAQGADASQVKRVFGNALCHVLASSSRGVLRAGPTARRLRDAAARTVDDISQMFQ